MTYENASDMAARLMREVDSLPKSNYTKGEIKTMLNMVSQRREVAAVPADPAEIEGTCRMPGEVTEIRRGDVFIAKLVGGKVRPWIALRTDGEVVFAVAMSSGDSFPRAIKGQSRYWPGSWMGGSVSIFSADMACREVMRPYENHRHLAEIEAHLMGHFSLQEPKVTSISDIASKFRNRGAA